MLQLERYKVPEANGRLWKLSVYVELKKGEAGNRDVSGHPTEEIALLRFQATMNMLGNDWYMVIVWIVPPAGQGKPKRLYRRIRRTWRRGR